MTTESTRTDPLGFLADELMVYIGRSLKVPLSRVYGVATFYNFFSLKPKGEHTCVVCMGTACYVKGAADILAAAAPAGRLSSFLLPPVVDLPAGPGGQAPGTGPAAGSPGPGGHQLGALHRGVLEDAFTGQRGRHCSDFDLRRRCREFRSAHCHAGMAALC